MLKEVDFTAIVFKVAFLWILASLGHFCFDSWRLFVEEPVFHIGVVVFLILLLVVCCFKATHVTPETEDTRRVTEFVFRIWGLYQGLLLLNSYRWLRWILVENKGFMLRELQMMLNEGGTSVFLIVSILIFGLSVLFFPCFWNRLILVSGYGIRWVIEKDREG